MTDETVFRGRPGKAKPGRAIGLPRRGLRRRPGLAPAGRGAAAGPREGRRLPGAAGRRADGGRRRSGPGRHRGLRHGAAGPNRLRPPTEPGDDEEDAPLDFLQPSTKPGSLGRLGHYEVLEVLGRGGFGIVLKAFDEMLHRVVAIKVMAPQLAATSPARKRFLREARAAAAVRHENVVAIHAVEEQPIPYLVMEFIAGETLQQKLDRIGPLDVSEVLRIGLQIAEGLAAAHARG